MYIRKDDNVIVLTGKDRGKKGKVLRAFPQEGKVIVEGVNLRKKHQRATKAGQKGQLVEKPMPLNVSNVSLVDPKTGKASRAKVAMVEGKKIRTSIKSAVAF